VAVAAFHLAYGYSTLSLLILVYLLALSRLAQARTGRQAFYLGLATGLLTVAPQMSCFWAIFGTGAAALWLVLAIWIGLFVALARLSRLHFGAIGGALLVPFLWTGLEYLRSELYYLRFSWLNIGYAFSGSAFQPLLKWFGVYGIGFLAAAAVSGVSLLKPKRAALAVLGTSALAILALFLNEDGSFQRPPSTQEQGIMVAGVQLEFPSDADVVAALDKLQVAYPDAELLVLSEYTFDGPVPETIR